MPYDLIKRFIIKKQEGILFVASAPSGGGKTTILNRAVKESAGLERSVSYTTRPRRMGETEGVDYHFASKDLFSSMLGEGLFLEWAEVYGHLYGTPVRPIEERIAAGLDTALAIDVQGAREVRKRFPDAVLIFIMPPSLDELEKRLKKRGSEDNTALSARLESVKSEISTADEYDYIIINHQVEESVTELLAIIIAERLRRQRYGVVSRWGRSS